MSFVLLRFCTDTYTNILTVLKIHKLRLPFKLTVVWNKRPWSTSNNKCQQIHSVAACRQVSWHYNSLLPRTRCACGHGCHRQDWKALGDLVKGRRGRMVCISSCVSSCYSLSSQSQFSHCSSLEPNGTKRRYDFECSLSKASVFYSEDLVAEAFSHSSCFGQFHPVGAPFFTVFIRTTRAFSQQCRLWRITG